MREVERFPRRVKEIENVWIEMADGCRLAARIWLPEDADTSPVPALLEYLPYRKRDLTRTRDEPIHHYLAGHGYASVRVDVRGAGDSEGILLDEYCAQELEDGVRVIAWLAAQPWCTGRVGMFGISWGGFNSLQVAALQPPELGAVISVCSTDDRYRDDAHYMGGCLLNENQLWGSMLFTHHALPPDPEIAGAGWRERWMERLARMPLPPADWLRHPHRDAFWRHGSVCEDFARIRCPVYAIGGWADAYRNAVPRLLEGLRVPRKGLIGPWPHAYPHDGVPGPAIGFLQEALRWWDHWLKGRESGIMDEPMLRVWMQESVRPEDAHPERPGRWVAEACWPSPRIRTRRLHTGLRSLEPAPLPAPAAARSVASPQTTGACGGVWCAFGARSDLPADQRPDDGRSLVFDSEPLAERLEILGAPVADLELEADQPVAMIALRLCDVAADGTSTRVTYGLCNLTHREGHAEPAPLEPGRRTRVRVALCDIAHAFPPGHRIRLAISTSYWPIAWPAPRPVTITLHAAGCALELPERPPSGSDAALAPFPPPEQGPVREERWQGEPRYRRAVEQDLARGTTAWVFEGGRDEHGEPVPWRLESIGLDVARAAAGRFQIAERDPLSARTEVRHSVLLRRDAWSVRVETEVGLSATVDAFRCTGSVRAFEGALLVWQRDWDERIPRDLL